MQNLKEKKTFTKREKKREKRREREEKEKRREERGHTCTFVSCIPHNSTYPKSSPFGRTHNSLSHPHRHPSMLFSSLHSFSSLLDQKIYSHYLLFFIIYNENNLLTDLYRNYKKIIKYIKFVDYMCTMYFCVVRWEGNRRSCWSLCKSKKYEKKKEEKERRERELTFLFFQGREGRTHYTERCENQNERVG